MATADSKASEKKKKGGSKGLRPSFPVQRQDMMQFPQYTNYFDGDDGAAFQQEQASGDAAPPSPDGVDASPAGGAPLAGGSFHQTSSSVGGEPMQPVEEMHPLEEALPLPRTSNMQVLEPIGQIETWEQRKPPMGTRGLGM